MQWPLLAQLLVRVRFPTQEWSLTFLTMEVAADGAGVRTEAANKAMLREMGLQVRHADTFLRNDCLIDSLLQSLIHVNLVHSTVNANHRDSIAVRVRQHLRDLNRTGPGFDYLSHDEHLVHIFEFLLAEERDIWTDLNHAHDADITITVYDRFQGRRLVDRWSGQFSPRVPSHPHSSYSMSGAQLRASLFVLLHSQRRFGVSLQVDAPSK